MASPKVCADALGTSWLLARRPGHISSSASCCSSSSIVPVRFSPATLIIAAEEVNGGCRKGYQANCDGGLPYLSHSGRNLARFFRFTCVPEGRLYLATHDSPTVESNRPAPRARPGVSVYAPYRSATGAQSQRRGANPAATRCRPDT